MREDLSHLTPEERPATVWAVDAVKPTDALGSMPLALPWYRTEAAYEVVMAARHSDVGQRLLDFLWENGLFKLRLTRADGAPVRRDGWEVNAWGRLLRWPLDHLLESHVLTRASLRQDLTPWAIDEPELHRTAAALADRIASGMSRVRAVSPIAWLKWPEGFPQSYELEEGVRLRAWTMEEYCVFMTHHGDEYQQNQLLTGFNSGCVEIEFRAHDSEPAVLQRVAETLDRVKWALMVAAGATDSFHESSTVIDGGAGRRYRPLRREALPFDGRSHFSLRVSAETLQQAKARLEELGCASGCDTRRLSSALTFLGRALTASLGRDSLLEAAIGLEGLCVRKGQNTYKFPLHVAAVLRDALPDDDVFPDLKKIYDVRSGAAHGSLNAGDDPLAPRARFLLAQAVAAVLDLRGRGELVGPKIPEAIEALVRRRTTGYPRVSASDRAPGGGNSPTEVE